MDKTARICIVGAGPGGLATAFALKEAGYSNVTVYEKTAKVGGQVYSKKYISPKGKEIIYEQCALQPMGSRLLNKMIKRYGLHYAKKRKMELYSLVDRKLVLKFTLRDILTPYLFVDMAKLVYVLFKYRCLWKPGFFKLKHIEDLAKPFEDWVEEQNFNSIIGLLFRYTILGFLTFHKTENKVPMCYGLKTFMQGFHFPVRYINGVLKQIEEGYQEIWNRVADDLDVKTNASIKSIKRSEESIVVNVNDENIEFDQLIIACQEYSQFLDCTEEESFIESKRKKIGSCRVGFIAKNCPIEGAVVFTDCIDGKKQEQCVGITAYGLVDDDKQFLTASLVIRDDRNAEEFSKVLNEALLVLGGELEEIISIHKEPNYAGYFAEQDLLNGILERSENRQGIKNTYFVGEMMSYGSNAIISDYANALVKKYF